MWRNMGPKSAAGLKQLEVSFGKIWENDIETCKISCKKRVASPVSIHDAGCLGLVTGMTQRDGMGREEGGGFRMGNTCIPVADSF